MGASSQPDLEEVAGLGATEIRKHWGWLLAWGIVTILAGWLMLSHLVISTFITVLFIGIAAIAGGISQIIYALQSRHQKGFIWILLWGILTAVAGVLICMNPLVGTLAVTLVVATFLLIGGIWKIYTAARVKVVGRGWLVFNAVVNLLLAVLLYTGWPQTAFFVPGLFVGIEFFIYGIWIVLFAMAARKTHVAFETPAHAT